MNWYINQQVVCIKTHSRGIVKEGEIYTIYGLSRDCCSNHILIDVGVKEYDHDTRFAKILCPERKHYVPNDGVWWVYEKLFAPLADISELEEILKQQHVNG